MTNIFIKSFLNSCWIEHSMHVLMLTHLPLLRDALVFHRLSSSVQLFSCALEIWRMCQPRTTSLSMISPSICVLNPFGFNLDVLLYCLDCLIYLISLAQIAQVPVL